MPTDTQLPEHQTECSQNRNGTDRKVALVTGGSRGIGAATARRLAEAGYDVAVGYAQSREAAEAVAARIRAGSNRDARAVQADLRQPEAIRRLFEEVDGELGAPSLLVNSAGISRMRALEEIDAEHVAWHFDLNVRGLLFAAQEATRRFRRQGGGGHIINVTSTLAQAPAPESAVYAASKAAVEAATRALAKELGPEGIRVNAVAPGPTDTDNLRPVDGQSQEEFLSFIAERTSLGRLAQPDDISGAIALLASEKAAWITGEVIAASGGFAP